MSVIDEKGSTEVLAMVHQTLLGEALDCSSLLAFAADEDMRYVAVNNAACQLLGYTRAEILQLRVSDIAFEPTAPGEFAEMVASGNMTGTANLRTKSGETARFVYFATETRVANIPFYLAIGAATLTEGDQL